MKKVIVSIVIYLVSSVVLAGHNSSSYFVTYKDLAIEEMHNSGIPASITLAQGYLESGRGVSELATKSNNHFGIKCKKSWTGEKVYHDDDAKGECFRKYSTIEDSYRDHSEFLKTRSWYAPLFKLELTDYKGWAKGLKKAGYATNPAYPKLLISIIEQHGLDEFDKVEKVNKVNNVGYFEMVYNSVMGWLNN